MSVLKNSLNYILVLGILPVSLYSQDVSVLLSDVTVDGYTEDIIVPVTLINPDHNVGGFQFDVIANPAMVEMTGLTPMGAGSDFSADYTVFSDGSARVVFYNSGGPDGIPMGNDGIVLNLHFDGTTVLSAVLDLYIYDLIVSDDDGQIVSSEGGNGSVTIGHVIYMSATSDTGDVLETVNLEINMTNSGIVGGLQFDIFDTPNYVDLTDLTTTDRTTGFSVDWNDVAVGDRVVLYGPDNSNISSGEGPILTATFQIHEDAYADDVGINIRNVIVTDDIGGTYWIATADSGTVTVTPGYIEEPHNLAAQSGMDTQVLLTWDPPYGPIPPEFSEDFESGELPADWTVLTNGNGWYVTENGSSAFWTIPSHTYYAVTNDDGFNGENTPENDGNDYLLTPSFNMSGATNVILNFASYFDGAYGEVATVEVSTDGVNFEVVQTVAAATEWVMTAVDLSEYGDQQNVVVAFHGNDNGGWASGWAIDDILITFSSAQVSRNLHFELTELGEWFVTADKEDVVGTYPSGIPFDWRIDIDNPLSPENRPVEIDEYNIYRSVGDDQNFELLESVDGDQTSYLDESVVNSTTYFYYVTAVYPTGVESGPTGTVEATPAEWVELWMSSGQSLSAQLDTLNFYLNNESQVGLFYFEIQDWPDILHSMFILPTERTESWSLEIVDMANGNMAITGISLGEPLEPGDGAVCRAVVYPISEEETTVSLTYADASVQDINFIEMNWTSEGAVYNVTIETQYLTLTGGYGVPGTQMTSSLLLQNTQPVFGIQIDIIPDPPFMMGAGLVVSDLIDFSTWSISGDQIGAAYRILLYDNTLSQPIPPGLGHVADITLDMLGGSPEGEMLMLGFGETVISDINNLPLHTIGSPADVYIGQPPVAYSISNVSGGLSPGGTGSFDIYMTNTENAYIVELKISDVPEYLTVTGITTLDRFENGTIDGSSGEDDDQMFYFLGYEFTTGIMPGEGPILRVEVEMNQNIQNPSVMLLFESVATGDDGANPIISVAEGFGQFIPSLSNDESASIPNEFALHPNYPNPFNPATFITYDLPIESRVQLDIYDLMGRKMKTLNNGIESAGRNTVVWYATDNHGISVSAGVYIYRFHAGDRVFTRKMILMK